MAYPELRLQVGLRICAGGKERSPTSKSFEISFGRFSPDIIYHLASHVMGAPGLEHVLPTFHGNLQTSVNLLTVAAESGLSQVGVDWVTSRARLTTRRGIPQRAVCCFEVGQQRLRTHVSRTL